MPAGAPPAACTGAGGPDTGPWPAAGAIAGFVSGSGPTIAFLVADADGAESLAQKLHIEGYRALAASGPAAGVIIREED